MKKCTKCGQIHPLSEFGKHRLAKDGLTHRCKECSKKHSKQYRESPVGIFQNIKGRIIYRDKRELYFTRDAFLEWWNSHPKICAYCGITQEEFANFQEHYKMKIRRMTIDRKNNSGQYTIDNIVMACHRCNSIKSDWFTYDEMKEIADKYMKPRIEVWRKTHSSLSKAKNNEN